MLLFKLLPPSFPTEAELDGISMGVLGVGVPVPCFGSLRLLQLLQTYSNSVLSLLLRMRRQRLLSFSWAQPTSFLAGRRNPCSHGVNQMSPLEKVMAALMYLIQVFIADQTWVTDSNVL